MQPLIDKLHDSGRLSQPDIVKVLRHAEPWLGQLGYWIRVRAHLLDDSVRAHVYETMRLWLFDLYQVIKMDVHLPPGSAVLEILLGTLGEALRFPPN